MRTTALLASSVLLAACRSPETPRPVRGPEIVYRVVDSSGAVVAGARGFWILDQRSARDAATALRETAEGVTDAEGRLRLRAPPEGVRGYLSVWVETPAGTGCICDGVYPQGDGWTVEPEPYEVPERDRLFRILVVDREGAPVPGATATLCRSADGAPLPFHPVLRGDDRGFVLGRQFAYGGYFADLQAPGRAPLRVCPYQFSDADSADHEEHFFGPIVLPPGRTVRGRVSADGQPPPPGAWLRCSYDSTKRHEKCEWFLPLGPTGEFEAVVRADAPCRLEAGAPRRADVTREVDGEVDITLDLPPAR